MSKRVDMIAPFEALRGNVSGKQKLQYALNNNPAYDAPAGRNYARNYAPRYVVSKVGSTGNVHFACKRRASTNITTKSRQSMALLGGTGALIGAILSDKSSTLYRQLLAMYQSYVDLGEIKTFRAVLFDHIYPVLASKQANITLAGPGGSVVFKNPWFGDGMTTGAQVSQAVLVKFWSELSNGGIYYKIDSLTGIAFDGSNFDDIIQNTALNILSLSKVTAAGETQGAIKLGDYFVNYISEGVKYTANNSDDVDLPQGNKYFTSNDFKGFI